MTTKVDRNAAVVEAWREPGSTLRSVAAVHGITAERVRQIVLANAPEEYKARQTERTERRKREAYCRCGAPKTYKAKLCVACARKAAAEARQDGVGVVWTKDRIVETIRRWAADVGSPPAAADWNVAMARRLGRSLPPGWSHEDHPALHTVQKRFGSWSAALAAAGYS